MPRCVAVLFVCALLVACEAPSVGADAATGAPDLTGGVDAHDTASVQADAGQDAAPDSPPGPDSAPGADSGAELDTAPDPDAVGDATADPDAATQPQCATAADCPAPAPCQLATCTAAGKCSYTAKADGQSCDDGNACSTGDSCASGACSGPNTLNCNDESPCTLDKCNPLAGCLNMPVAATTACDDGSACTANDTCLDGKCQAGANICQCKSDADCGKFEDGDLCNGTLYCDKAAGAPYTCKLNPATVVVCGKDKDGPCQQNTCIPSTGACSLVVSAENTPCSDGDKCSVGDYCAKGLCMAGTNTCFCKDTADCKGQEDGNACNGTLFCNKASAQCEVNPATVVTCQTVGDTFCRRNTCNPKDGFCHYIPWAEGKACDDGNACTPNEQCQAGQCTTATNTCECQKDADCVAKEDGNLCNGTLYCDLASSKCKVNPATVVACNTDDDPACLRDVCNAKSGKCEALALPKEGTACSDGNPCTPVDFCKGGQCVATANTCECQQDADCKAKEDGDLCNGTLFCDKAAGKCVVNPATVVQCTGAFDEVCLKNQCDPKTGGCGMKPALQGNQCPGDNACSAGGWCVLGTCETSGQSVCTCEKDLDCNKFEDGDLCNGTLYCDKTGAAPACKLNPTTVVVCPKGGDSACVKNQCAADTGKCGAAQVKGACEDGNPCTTADLCSNGGCQGGAALVCNDGNACTVDQCQAGFGCVYQAADASACDDQNVCTSDQCNPGVGCTHGFAVGLCDDGNACSNGDQCKLGACKGDLLDCEDGNLCTDDACKPEAKGCVHLPNAATCSDGNLCTTQDVCSLGKCSGGGATDCSDGNPCTSDSCAPKLGCQYGFAAGGCDDGSACTLADACKDGTCTGSAKSCDDQNPCTDDACDPKAGCKYAPNNAPCSDGNACTGGDACAAGKCASTKTTACDDQNPCTDDGCDSIKGCLTSANTSACDDGNACTQKDLCKAGQCGGVPNCDDGNPCTDEACDGGKCASALNSQGCNDGNACTTGDKCAAGKCLGTGKLTCDDGNVCTDDSCDPGAGCTSVGNSQGCDDANACTVGDKCKLGQCGGAKKSCDDNNPCTDDACDVAKGCTATDNTIACDDGKACTANDACKAGACTGGAKNCDDGNVCTVDACLTTTGQCQNTDTGEQLCADSNACTDDVCHPVLGCGHSNNSAACSDGNPCTTGDGCANGKCAAPGTLVCDDSKLCTDDSCDAKQGCVFADNTKPCNDGVACTKEDACKAGACAGTLNCDDGQPCTDDTCDFKTGTCKASPSPVGQACDDGDKCTAESVCKDGQCAATKPAVCDDGNVCTDDLCDKLKGCQAYSNTLGCSASPCSGGDQCSAGKCVGSGKPRFGYWGVQSNPASEQILYDAQLLSDGSYVAVGSNRQAVCGQYNCNYGSTWDTLVVRVKGSGELDKKVLLNYSPTGYQTQDHLRRVTQLPDGTLVGIGTRNDPDPLSPKIGQMHLLHVKASDLSVVASYGVDNPQATHFGEIGQSYYWVDTAKGKRLVIGGTTEYLGYGGTRNVGVWVVSPTGQVEGFGTHPEGYDQSEVHIAPAPGGGVAAVATTGHHSHSEPCAQQPANIPGLGSDDIELVLFDANLKCQRLVRLGSNGPDAATGITATSGGYLIAGTIAEGAGSPVLYRVDSQGAQLWKVVLGNAFYADYGGPVQLASDGVAVLVGSTYHAGYGQQRASLWRVDGNGNKLSDTVMLSNGWGSRLHGLAILADGSLLGSGASNPSPTSDALLWRVDPWTHLDCTAAGKCLDKPASYCEDGEFCTSPQECDGATGNCKYLLQTGACTDGDACTEGEKCGNGKCGGSTPKICDDKNPCTSDWCDKALGCQTSVLADGFACATGKSCSAGVCK